MSTDESDKDEPKTERFNMFMSPSEMKAIDDWAWENRVRSKSEAVRRLVQIGLRFGKEGPKLLGLVLEALFEAEDALKEGKSAGLKATEAKTVDAIIAAFGVMLKGTDKTAARQMEVVDEFMALISEISPFMTNPEFDAATEKADEVRKQQAERGTETAKMVDDLKRKFWP